MNGECNVVLKKMTRTKTYAPNQEERAEMTWTHNEETGLRKLNTQWSYWG